MGTATERQDKTKRRIKPTNRLGTNVALKGRQHLYATESRTYQKNRTLLMVPASQAVPAIPVFPANVLAAPTLGEVLHDQNQTSTLPADQGSAVLDATGHSVNGTTGQPVTDATVHPANLAADIALAMSAAPFTGRHFSHW